jgi:hypothetical protein
MKNLTFVGLLLILPFIASAQSMSITHSEDRVYGDTMATNVVAHALVINNTSSPIDVKVRRTANDLAAYHQSYFCWDICYGPGKDESDDPMTIEPGDTADYFRGYLKPYNTPGTSQVMYCFFNQTDVSDSTCILITYIIEQSSGVASASYILSEAYPNPVSESLTVPYLVSSVQNASISVSDMFGRTLLHKELNAPSGTIKIDVSEFASGVYLYTLVTERGTITRRFVRE